MTPSTVTPITVKVTRKFYNASLELEKKSVDLQFSPAATVAEAIERLNGEVLSKLNKSLAREFKITSRKSIEIPADAIKVGTIKALDGVLSTRKELKDLERAERKKALLTLIKGDEKLRALAMTLNEVQDEEEDEDEDNEKE